MDSLTTLAEPDFFRLGPLLLSLGEIVAAILIVWVGHILLSKYFADRPTASSRRQLLTVVLGFVVFIATLTVLPIDNTVRGQLLSLIGILVSAAIALSSTTFIGNAMAGVMLRSIGGFRAGDMIRVGDAHIGRVTEIDLLHTELQNEDRDLTTLPNLYLVTNPVKVVRQSGTILSAQVSLGYDVPHGQIESLLVEAAKRTGLEKPFVQVVELGDFSVVYRVAGLLTELESIIERRSRLRAAMLDALHEGGIEIVSPNFMNQRVLATDLRFIPAAGAAPEIADAGPTPEAPDALIFDKADKARTTDEMQLRQDELAAEIGTLENDLPKAQDAEAKAALEKRIAALREESEALLRDIEAAKQELEAP